MVELKLGPRTVNLPYTIRINGVSERRFDDLVDEDTRAELLDGVMIVHSPASLQHDDIGGFLRTLMRIHASMKQRGKVLGPDSLIRLGRRRKFAPDLYFLKQKRVPRRLDKKQFRGVPDLAAEVLSPSNRSYDLDEKRLIYREARIDEIWFIDPDACEVIVDYRHRQHYVTETVTAGRVCSRVLEGFWMEAAWLWAEPLPNEIECLEAILNS